METGAKSEIPSPLVALAPSIFQAAPDAIVVVASDGRIQLANDRVRNLFGHEPASLLGRPIEELIPQRFRTAHVAHRNGFVRDPKVRPMGPGLELWGLRKDGTEFPVEISLSPVHAGSQTLIMAAVRDVTERRRTEAILRASEARFRGLLEAAPDAIVIADAAGRISLVNTQAVRLFGYAPDELVGQEVEILVPERSRAKHPAFRQQFVEKPRARPMGAGVDLFGRRKNGTEFPVEISLSPLETSEGLVVMAAVRDVTEQKILQAELARRATALSQTNQELERFAYVSSHDMQEPLRAMSSYVQLLSQNYRDKLDETGLRWMGFVTDAADRMQALIQDLLAYSRIQTRGAPMVTFDLGEAVRDAQRNLDHAIQDAKATVQVEPLPTVVADPRQMVLLFQNLLGNALKFRRVEEPPFVRVRVEDQKENWAITVRDNGIGFDPRYKEKVFEVFQRLNTREAYPGTGIGLAICQRVVQRHGGKIWAESKPGEGATFTFALPKKAPPNVT